MSIETLRPNAAGDETNIGDQYPGSGSHYDKVDEATADGDTTYVGEENVATYNRDLYNVADHSAGSGTINHITVYAVVRTINDPEGYASLKIAIKSGATVSESSEITVTTSYATYSNQWSTDPNTGLAWTWAAIDALQIGIALRHDGNWEHTRCTQVYVKVDYSAVTEKTSSDTGSGVDAYVSLETGEAKLSSDTGSGVEGTPLPSAFLAGNETGSGIEALVARLLAAVDTGTGVEVGGLLKDLFATELGLGSDSLTAKIETPTKGGGMKLWT